MKKLAYPTAEVLIYPHPDGEITARHLSSKDVRETAARQILSLMGQAYANEFEGRGLDAIPEGTMRHHFNNEDPTRVAAQQERMAKAIARGSSYWITFSRPEGHEPTMLSLAKISPSYPSLQHKIGKEAPELYIDDMAALPESNQAARRGLGSVALHSALVYGGYKVHANITADTYTAGQSSRSFLTAHGFTLQNEANPDPTSFIGLDGNTFDMPMERYQAPDLRDVVDRLEANHPWLAQAEFIR